MRPREILPSVRRAKYHHLLVIVFRPSINILPFIHHQKHFHQNGGQKGLKGGQKDQKGEILPPKGEISPPVRRAMRPREI